MYPLWLETRVSMDLTRKYLSMLKANPLIKLALPSLLKKAAMCFKSLQRFKVLPAVASFLYTFNFPVDDES